MNAAEDWRRHPHIRCNSHGNHIFGDLFATAHARIVTVGNDVAEAPFPINQPEDVDINEIVFRPTKQDL